LKSGSYRIEAGEVLAISWVEALSNKGGRCMKVCALDIERTQSDRCKLYSEIIKQLGSSKLDCLIFPGGFFEGKKRKKIINYLRNNPPGFVVIIGWDEKFFKESKKDSSKKGKNGKREIWAVSSNGEIGASIPEAWKASGKYNNSILKRIKERRYASKNVDVDLYCCGDILNRKERIYEGKFAAVTVHKAIKGRWFSAMERLKKPVFISQFVKYPFDVKGMACNGKRELKYQKPAKHGLSELTEWKARIYRCSSR
jgi:hypothetical protein